MENQHTDITETQTQISALQLLVIMIEVFHSFPQVGPLTEKPQ
jgi:hypothetical protein